MRATVRVYLRGPGNGFTASEQATLEGWYANFDVDDERLALRARGFGELEGVERAGALTAFYVP